MPKTVKNQHKLRVSGLNTQQPCAFEMLPDSQMREQIAVQLGLLGLRKLRFEGQIYASGDSDWGLSGDLGATLSQPCVLTLAPVTTRIDTKIERLFLAQIELPDPDEEYEIPTNDNSEPLGSHIDLNAVMVEALSLALPLYPKADGASLKTSTFTKDGTTPMSDEAARPFAGLAGLRDKLDKDE